MADDGQLLVGSLMDYLVPTASDIPSIEIQHTETPSALGEGGAIAPSVTIVNAVCDALRPLRFEISPASFCILKALRRGAEA